MATVGGAGNVYIWGDDPQGRGDPRSPHAVLSHGTLLTFGDNPIDFDIRIKDDLARIRFEFPRDSAEVRLEYVVREGTQGSKGDPPTVIFRFFNLVYVGGFSDGPVRIGTIGGIALWLCYEVGTVLAGQQMKRIHYTIWDGSGPSVPQQLLPTHETDG